LDPFKTILSLTNGWDLPRDEEKSKQLISAYFDLSLAEGKKLADTVLQSKDEKTCEIVIRNLALLVPGSLEGKYTEIIERRFFDWYEYFQFAGPDDRDHIIELIHTETDSRFRRELIYALSWIGDDEAQKQLALMKSSKMVWDDRVSSEIAPIVADLIPMAGWELTDKGQRRDLYLPMAYDLELIGRRSSESLQESCPWCGTKLIMTFQFDLQDPKLADIGLSGEELAFGMCSRCVQYTTIFTEINTKGGFHWSPHNDRPPELPGSFPDPDDIGEFWSTHKTKLGSRRRSPYELVAWLPSHPQQIGGFPGWVQWPEYPKCPSCKRRMLFLAQLDYALTGCASGVTYAFLCKECMMGAMNMQCD
jgi:hypothetical protein